MDIDIDNFIENKRLKPKITNKLWENCYHIIYILPNILYKKEEDKFSIKNSESLKVLDENLYIEDLLFELNRESNLTIYINEDNISYQHTIFYHICREERKDGIVCIVGIPEHIYLTRQELRTLGKCLEMKILKLKNSFNLTKMMYFGIKNEDEEDENKFRELGMNSSDILYQKEEEKINRFNEKYQELINKRDSVIDKPLLL